MLPVYFFTTLPPSAWAATSDDNPPGNPPGPVLTPENVHVNKHGPRVTTYAGVQISAMPTDSDITYSHAFREPLVPVGGKTSSSENQSLGAAIKTYLQRKDDENVSALTDFLDQYSNSAWRASLDLNLAEVFFRTGNFSKALDAWQDAWDRTQNLNDTTGQQIANLAVGKLAEMKARIGRTDELDALYKQIKGRSMSGVAAQLLVQARSGLWLMQNRPQDAFRCGPSALQELSLATKGKIDHPEIIKQSRSTPQGIALSDVQALAAKIDMPMQMAKRTAGATFIVPAVIHWKLGHYAALVGQRDGKYIVHDTTFGGAQFLISAQALEQETSGYFLVPTGALPTGWTSVGKQEGNKVMGRGNPGDDDPTCLSANDSDSGDGDCGAGGTGLSVLDPNADGMGDPITDPDSTNSSGDNNGDNGQPPLDMTVSAVKAMLVSLSLMDTPVGYVPPLGPAMHFTVHYSQREFAQPATFTYANLGPNWTFTYLSYVMPGSGTASVYVRGGGVETYYYDSSIGGYDPNQVSQAVLTQVNSTTWQRTLPGGEIETFGQPSGSGEFFLSKITDPHGNSLTLSYDSHLRLVSLTDAIGQVTTVTYVSNTVGNAEYYNIAQVTDPFGRSAQFAYDGSGRLQKITDIIGITSQFSYSGATTFVNSLTTPYGVTSFAFGDISTDPSLGTTRWLNTTYPDGNTTRTEYNENQYPSGVNTSTGADTVGIPYGMYSGSGINGYMEFRNTYYWDKQAMKTYPGNYTQAEVTHWMHTSDINTCSDIQESLKKVDQNRIWYAYSGEISSIQASNTMIAKPTQKGRVLGTGTPSSSNSQIDQYQYNAIGKVTKQTDPLGRETDYAYAANNMDLLTVKQKNGSGYDLLATYTYNSQHEVLTVTDASGQTTTNTYYPNGELHTTANALGQTTTCAYTNGYLSSVTGPVSGSTTSFTYDGYGRVRTTTDSQGYTTTFNYDVMDRPTFVIYPDGTTSEINYVNLDATYAKDRLGRWTRTLYNAIRQPVTVMDSMGNATVTNWSLSAGPLSIVDPSGHMTQWTYDNQNRVTRKTYPDSNYEQIAYESTTSRVLNTTDANGSVATPAYNLDNTVASVSYTAGSGVVSTPTVSYTYNSVYPRVSTMTDGTGTTTYNYNAVTGTVGSNMLGSVAVPVPMNSSTYATISITSYDQLGRVLSEKVNDSAITGQGLSDSVSSFTYDTLGRVTNVSNPLSGSGSFVYAYLNNTGRVASVTNPNGQSTVYTYQDSTTPNEPRLSEIKNLSTTSAVISKFDYGYDAQSQITSWTQTTPATTDPQNWAMQYDNEGKLLNVNDTDTVTGVAQNQYAYTYDAAGNRTSEQIDGNSVTSSYNTNNQLSSQNQSGSWSLAFAGSLNKPGTVTVGGNAAVMSNGQTNFRGTASVTPSNSVTNNVPIVATNLNGYATTNTFHVLVPTAASPTFAYDHEGNLLTDGTRTFAYDAKNEMTSIVYSAGPYSGTHTEFTYNGLGQRVAIVERTGTTVGSGTITSTKQYVAGEERNASNNVTKRYFAQGEQRISGSTATSYFYTFDHLGSIREVINSSGTIQAEYAYDPYGRRTQVSGSFVCDFGFTGHYWHVTSSLYLSPTRAYDPNLGRWISRDPSGEGAGLNLYAYCANSPINLTDPTGLDPDFDSQEEQLSRMEEMLASSGCMDSVPFGLELADNPYNGGSGDGGLAGFGNDLLTNAGSALGVAALSGVAKADALVSQLDTALALAEAAGDGEAVDKILDILKTLATDDPDASDAQRILDHLNEVLTNHGLPEVPDIDPNKPVTDQINHIINQYAPVPVVPEQPATPPAKP
jgi:RHS repeat-associated protein